MPRWLDRASAKAPAEGVFAIRALLDRLLLLEQLRGLLVDRSDKLIDDSFFERKQAFLHFDLSYLSCTQ